MPNPATVREQRLRKTKAQLIDEIDTLEQRAASTPEGGTELKRREQELAEKETQLRVALDNMPGGIRLVDNDRNYVFFNQQYLDLYDFPEGLLEVGESNRVEILYSAQRGDFGPGDPDALTDHWRAALPVQSEATSWVRETIAGKTLQVRTAPTPDGGVVNIVIDITERKRAEEALRQSQAQLKGIVDNSPAIICLKDHQGRYLLVNKRFEELHDVASDQILGKTAHEIFPKVVADAFVAHDKEVIETGSPIEREQIITSVDGPRTVIEVKFPIFSGDDDGVAALIGLIATDITERKRAERELAEKEAQLRVALDNMPGGMKLVDRDLNYVIFNPQYEEWCDFPDGFLRVGRSMRDELYFQAVRGDYGPGDKDELVEEVVALYRKREAVSVERKIPGGRTLQINIAPVPEGGHVSILTDITARKRAEEALRESEARFRAFLDHSPDAITLKDANGCYLLGNNEFERQSGISSESLHGKIEDEVFPGNAELLSAIMEHEQKVIETKAIVREEREADDHDGTPRSFSITKFPILDGEGNVAGIGTTKVDITERKKIERMKNEFVSTVSHELRTPLTSIAGSLDLLFHGVAGEIPDQAMPMIEIAQKNSQRLVRLINDILDIEKIEAGKMAFNYERIGVGELLEQAIAANQGYVDGLGVGLRLVSNAKTASVLGDLDLLMQVMTNLISNAAKFSPKHGEVEVAVTLSDEAVCIAVSDRGPGIPEAFRERIFEKFAQADSSDTRQRGGTGLGLSICKAIIERHGGKIGFESELGVGTTFSFELSRWRDAGGVPAAGAALGGPLQVLVCEDDPDVLTLLTMMLEREGFDVAPAASAVEAKRVLGEVEVAAMILDLALPDQDGISLIRELREDAATADLPIVVVSAKAKEGKQSLNGDAFGVVDWLEKPVDPHRLFTAIRRALSLVSGHKPRLLHVEDDADVLEVVRTMIGDDAVIVSAGRLSEARRRLRSETFDLVILDLMLPDGSGVDLLSYLHGPDGAPLPVVIFSVKEVSGEVAARVSAALVKSRASIDELVETIRMLVTGARSDPGPG